MPSQVTNYQCPACTGPLHFSGASGKLECDYCGSTYDVAEIEALYAAKDEEAAQAFSQAQAEETSSGEETSWDDSGMNSDWGEDASKVRVYQCPSCGAELICDASTAATSCPYCGNPSIIPGQFEGTLRPDCIIPFRLDKSAAVAALKQHYRGKRFLPKAFTRENSIQEIKSVYVPFWLFDGEADAVVDFDATRSHTHNEGDERVTITEHFAVHRAGTVRFQRIPVDASSKMPDAHMDAIEPFDYSELKPFSAAYLPGFLADKYDVSVEDSSLRADERAQNTAYQVMQSSVFGYDSVVPVHKEIALRRGKVQYALLPVWLLNTKWNGKDFLFAMNGQTGKLVGDLPISMGRFWTWFAGISLPLMAILAIVWLLLH